MTNQKWVDNIVTDYIRKFGKKPPPDTMDEIKIKAAYINERKGLTWWWLRGKLCIVHAKVDDAIK